MHFSDEDLIAYLLGDAPRPTARAIELELSSNDELAGRLKEFRQLLGQIDSVDGFYEPPANLVESTLARVDAIPPPERQPPKVAMPSFGNAIVPHTRSLLDSTVLSVCLAIICCLALPALIQVRFESRKAQCAQNLRTTGLELMQYALGNPRGRFPFVPPEGPDAFAGVFAVHLREAGVPLSPSQLRCASLLGYPPAVTTLELEAVPTFSELHQVEAHDLPLWQREIGGHYAYNLGVAEEGKLQAPKYDGRSHFAILADAPLITDDESEQFLAHDGRGINILFEDGRVQFISVGNGWPSQLELDPAQDNPFRNQLGVHEVGVHPHDASLAPSHFPPLGTSDLGNRP